MYTLIVSCRHPARCQTAAIDSMDQLTSHHLSDILNSPYWNSTGCSRRCCL